MSPYTISVEYRVGGALDGVTPAPLMALSPVDPTPITPDDDNIFVQEVDNLGLVDLTFSTGETFADRFVKWFVLYGPSTPTGSDNVRIVNVDGTTITPLRDVVNIDPGGNGVYSKHGFIVPQGAYLQLQNMVANGSAEPVVVRMGIWRPDSLAALAAIREAYCCRQVDAAPAGAPPSAQFDPNEGVPAVLTFCQRTVVSVTPPATGYGPPVTVTVTGTNFSAGDVVQLRDTSNGVIYSPPTTFVNSTTLTFELFNPFVLPPPTSGSAVVYDVIAGPPDIPGCMGVLPAAFTVVIPQ